MALQGARIRELTAGRRLMEGVGKPNPPRPRGENHLSDTLTASMLERDPISCQGRRLCHSLFQPGNRWHSAVCSFQIGLSIRCFTIFVTVAFLSSLPWQREVHIRSSTSGRKEGKHSHAESSRLSLERFPPLNWPPFPRYQPHLSVPAPEPLYSRPVDPVTTTLHHWGSIETEWAALNRDSFPRKPRSTISVPPAVTPFLQGSQGP